MSTTQLRPYINLKTLALVIPDHGPTFTGEEWHAMALPPCPKCGTTVNADREDVTGYADKVRRFMFGRWECPNECDPRALVVQCSNCERCTWNPGPDCGRDDHPHCPRCGHCEGRHA